MIWNVPPDEPSALIIAKPAALPTVTAPVVLIAPVTARPVAVTVVNTPVSGVVPPIGPGAGNDVTFAVPSKLLPPIVRTVVNFAALPVVFWLSVGKSAATAIVRAPVAVVDLMIPVARADVPNE